MFAKIGLVVQWLPRIIAVAMLVEQMFDESVSGEEKKENALMFLVRQGMPQAYVSVISSIVDLTVDVLHAVGIFKRAEDSENAGPLIAPVMLRSEIREVIDDDIAEVYAKLVR